MFSCTLAQAAEESAEEEQTEFTVNLVRFLPDSKIKLIKELKLVMEGINLVQVGSFQRFLVISQALKSIITFIKLLKAHCAANACVHVKIHVSMFHSRKPFQFIVYRSNYTFLH